MPINVYTGLQGSGKSYEVVSEVIVPAIRAGRDVVTNVDGISEERIYEFLLKREPAADVSTFGKIRHVTNEDVFQPSFFPYYDDLKTAHTDTTVQPGDLVCIDEAWRFWGSDSKLLSQHKSFFLEHRHFTHPVTHVSCDLVCMIQDMGTLHRFLKNVVAFSFRTHKKVSLGFSNTYSIQMFEGWKMNKKTQNAVWVRKYKKDVFPLYASFKGGVQGKIVNADKRQNIFSNRKLWAYAGVVLVAGIVAAFGVHHFFTRGKKADDVTAKKPDGVKAAVVAPVRPVVEFSNVWRIAGEVTINGKRFVIVSDAAGRMRYESPSMFSLSGPQLIGSIDDRKVTRWSGGVSESFLPKPEPKK